MRHVHKYHGHSRYYQATVLVLVIGYLTFIVAMAMVVMGDMCVQSITAIHTGYYVGNSD